MIEFILKYWEQFVFLFGIMAAVFGKLFQLIIKLQNESKALKEGVLAILHDRLFQACSFYIEKGYIPTDKFESVMDNVKKIYDSYSGLGGNGTGEDIYKIFKRLPVQKEKEKPHD